MRVPDLWKGPELAASTLWLSTYWWLTLYYVAWQTSAVSQLPPLLAKGEVRLTRMPPEWDWAMIVTLCTLLHHITIIPLGHLQFIDLLNLNFEFRDEWNSVSRNSGLIYPLSTIYVWSIGTYRTEEIWTLLLWTLLLLCIWCMHMHGKLWCRQMRQIILFNARMSNKWQWKTIESRTRSHCSLCSGTWSNMIYLLSF